MLKIDRRWLHFHRLHNISFFWFEISMLRLPSIKFITAVILDYGELWKSKCFTKLKSILFLLTYNSKITKVILLNMPKAKLLAICQHNLIKSLWFTCTFSHKYKQGKPKIKNMFYVFHRSLNWDRDLIWMQRVSYILGYF